jgi:hypothetical protein
LLKIIGAKASFANLNDLSDEELHPTSEEPGTGKQAGAKGRRARGEAVDPARTHL